MEEEGNDGRAALGVDVVAQQGLEVVRRIMQKEGSLDPASLRNVYLFGSRLYGCASPTSDYDLICLVDGPYFHACRNFAEESNENEEAGAAQGVESEAYELDVNPSFYHVDYFLSLVKKNMIATLLCLCIPKSFVWKEDVQLPSIEQVLRLPALRKVVTMDASHNLAKAKRLWSEGDTYKSKKNVVHGLRYLHYALQLVESGYITDFHVGNRYWEEVMTNPSNDWEHYEAKYRPLYQQLMRELKAKCEPTNALSITAGNSDNSNLPQQHQTGERVTLQTIDYLQKHGMDALCQSFALNVKTYKVGDDSELFHLTIDPFSSPSASTVVKECAYGLLLQRKQPAKEEEEEEEEGGDEPEETQATTWRVIARAYPKIEYMVDPFTGVLTASAAQLDWNSAKVYEKLDGTMAVLYHHEGVWRVKTSRSGDGYDEHIQRQRSLAKTSYREWLLSLCADKNNEMEVLRQKHKERVVAKEDKKDKEEEASFAELFWDIWKRSLNYAFPSEEETELLFVFEVLSWRQCNIVQFFPPTTATATSSSSCSCASSSCSSRNREERIVLHGVFDRLTMNEHVLAPFEEVAAFHGWECVRQFSFDELSQRSSMSPYTAAASSPSFAWTAKQKQDLLKEIVNRMNPFKEEGFVVADNHFNRLKVRAPQWAALSLLSWFNDSMKTNHRYLLEYIRRGEGNEDEFLFHFPEWRDEFLEVKEKYQTFATGLGTVYDSLMASERQLQTKERGTFAREARKHFFYGMLFDLRDAGCSNKNNEDVLAYFKSCPTRKVVSMMNKYFEDV